MRCRCAWWCICLSAAAFGAQGCSSDDTTGPSTGNDSGGTTSGIDATSGGDVASVIDSGSHADAEDSSTPMMICDASIVTTMNACTQCATMNCGMQLAMCAADCMCAQPETCALALSNVFILNKCPNAVNAGFSNQAFMAVNACLAQNCLDPCQHADGGAADGGNADSSSPDAGATEAGGADASGE